MPSVKMLYLRDGNEYLFSKARRTPLALHDKRHKGAGPHGTVHSFTPHMGVDPLFPWPKRPEFHWTLESLLESAPPPIKGRDIQLAWLGPEYSFWAQPMLPDPPPDHSHNEHCEMLHRPTPVELHKEVLQFYGTAYSLNGVQRSTAMDAKGDNADPVKIGFASLVILFALAACMMGVYVVMR